MTQCRAKSKRSGERCRREATPGHAVCASHGSKTPVGLANPNWRHGRFSKGLPARMVERFEAGLNDPELLSLRSELALVDARLEDVLTRCDNGESGQLWADLRKLFAGMQAAQSSGDIAQASEVLVQIGLLIQRGHDDHAAWREIGGLIERRRRLIETEARRLVQMQQTITVEQANALMMVVRMVVQKHVAKLDNPVLVRAVLTGISHDFYELGRRQAQNEPLLSAVQAVIATDPKLE